MKLVDILARDLKVWPEGFGDILGQCFTGELHSCSQVGRPSGLFTNERLPRCDQYLDETVTREQWQAAVDALNAEKCDHSHGNDQGCPECGEDFSPAWNGEGYPPAGCEIEAKFSETDWRRVLIIGRHGLRVVFYTDIPEGPLYAAWPASYFRPIRTAEQIAEDERECAITDMCVLLGKDPNRAGVHAMAGVLYDAGYRKQVAP